MEAAENTADKWTHTDCNLERAVDAATIAECVNNSRSCVDCPTDEGRPSHECNATFLSDMCFDNELGELKSSCCDDSCHLELPSFTCPVHTCAENYVLMHRKAIVTESGDGVNVIVDGKQLDRYCSCETSETLTDTALFGRESKRKLTDAIGDCQQRTVGTILIETVDAATAACVNDSRKELSHESQCANVLLDDSFSSCSVALLHDTTKELFVAVESKCATVSERSAVTAASRVLAGDEEQADIDDRLFEAGANFLFAEKDTGKISINDNEASINHRALQLNGAMSDELIVDMKAVIDCIYTVCDVDSSQSVVVSDVIYLIKNGTDGACGLTEDALRSLSHYLDPNQSNCRLSLIEFRAGFSAWMNSIGVDIKYSSDESNIIYQQQSVDKDRNVTVTEQTTTSCTNLKNVSNQAVDSLQDEEFSPCWQRKEPVGAENSLETSNGSEFELMEFQSRLASMEFQNKKLTDELLASRKQLETSDELCGQLSQQIDALQATIKAQHSAGRRMIDLRQQNDDLQSMLSAAEETRLEFLAQKKTMEQMLQTVNEENAELRQQIVKQQGEIDSLSALNQRLQESSEEQLKNNVKQIRNDYKKKLLESQMQYSDVAKQYEELHDINQALRNEKEQLERKLADLIQVVSGQHVMQSFLSANESNSTDDCNDSIPPLNISPSTAFYTPHFNGLSLCREISAKIFNEPMLPSPLCDKEFEDAIVRVHSAKELFKNDDDDVVIGSEDVVETVSCDDEEGDERQTQRDAHVTPSFSSSSLSESLDLELSPRRTLRWCMPTVATSRPAVVRALLRCDIINILKLNCRSDGTEFSRFVEQFINEIVGVLFTRNYLEQRNRILSRLVDLLKEFGNQEMARLQSSLSNLINDYNQLRAELQTKIATNKPPVTAVCDSLIDSVALDNDMSYSSVKSTTLTHQSITTTAAATATTTRAWCSNLFKVGVTIFVTGTLILCFLVGIGQTRLSPHLALRHLSSPPI